MSDQKKSQNEIIEKLFEDTDIKEAILEHTAIEVSNALDNFKKESDAKNGDKNKKKNVPVQPECFKKYVWGDTPKKCRVCRYAQDCIKKSKPKKETKSK